MSRRSPIRRKALPVLATAVLIAALAAPADAEDALQTVLLGLSAGPAWSSEAGADPEVVSRVLASAAWGYRSALGESGFVSVASGAAAQIDDAQSLEVRPSLEVETRTSAGPGSLEGFAGARASLLGDDPYVLADGRLGWRFEGDRLQPGAWLVGLLDARPETSDDIAGGGARLGVRSAGSVRFSVDASAGALIESWYETDVYTDSGAQSGDKRQDLVTDLTVEVSGLAGYFVEWSVGLRGSGRVSNANRLLAGGAVDSDSESRIGVAAWGSLSWNPTSALALELRFAAEPSWYLGREALSDTGVPTGDNLGTFDLDGTLRMDWSLGGGTWFVLEAEARGTAANDDAEESWDAAVRAGVEIAL